MWKILNSIDWNPSLKLFVIKESQFGNFIQWTIFLFLPTCWCRCVNLQKLKERKGICINEGQLKFGKSSEDEKQDFPAFVNFLHFLRSRDRFFECLVENQASSTLNYKDINCSLPKKKHKSHIRCDGVGACLVIQIFSSHLLLWLEHKNQQKVFAIRILASDRNGRFLSFTLH